MDQRPLEEAAKPAPENHSAARQGSRSLSQIPERQ